MPVDVISVQGIEEACEWLDGVSSIIATRAYVNGLDAAAEVMEAELWPRVPVDLRELVLANAAHGGKGALVTRITRDLEVDPRGRGGMVEIGFGSLGHIALWVEYGHRMMGHKAVLIKNGQVVISKKTGRPVKIARGQKTLGEVKPHPFMRPSFDASKDRAIEAFIEGVVSTLKGTPGYSEAA
jgi:hypothetical protein